MELKYQNSESFNILTTKKTGRQIYCTVIEFWTGDKLNP